MKLVKLEDIYYFAVLNKTVYIKTKLITYTASQALNYYEVKLQDSSFFRCHRAYLVNLDKVSRLIRYSKVNYDCGFADIRDVVPVSKAYLNSMQRLLEYWTR